MNEIFIDGPGTATSDGRNIKFTLQSVMNNSKGQYVSQDVVQLVCTLETAERISLFLSDFSKKQPRATEHIAPELNEQNSDATAEPKIEQKRLLSRKPSSAHE